MATIQQLLSRRYSAKDFLPSAPLADEIITLLLESARLAPSAYNLQHSKFAVVSGDRDKQLLFEAAYFQKKILTASANIIVLADLTADLNIAAISARCVAAGSYDQAYAERQCQQIAAIYQGDDLERRRRDEALRSASLASMCIMLQATEIGLGSCPLSGFDEAKLRLNFAIPAQLLPVMIISLGHSVATQPKARLPISELIFPISANAQPEVVEPSTALARASA